MKLVVLTRQFGMYTGATVSTIELLKRIKDKFARVVVVTMRTDGTQVAGVEFKIVSKSRDLKTTVQQLVAGDPEWVGYSDDHFGWMLADANVPYIHTYHGNWPDVKYQSGQMFLKSFFFIPMYKKTIRKAAVTVNVSHYMEKRFSGQYAQRSTVIYNGVKQTGDQAKKQPEHDRLMMVGNVDKRKYGYAVAVFKQVDPTRMPPVDIYGKIVDEKIATELRQYPFVHLQGQVDRIEFSQYTKFLCTSASENLPVSIVEALLQRVPVISFDVGGIKEVVTPTRGRVVARGDLTAFEQALFANDTYSFAGDDLADTFNWDNSARKYYELFKGLRR